MKKLFPLITLAFLALACNKVNTGGDKTLKSIAFAKESVSLEAGESEVFTIKLKPVNADAPKLVYESSAPGVAKVNGNKIVAISEGSAVITASVKDNPAISCQCNVTVKPFVDAVKVTSISVNKSNLEISDLGISGEADEALVSVQIEPASAGWKDLLIYAEDDDINLDTMDDDPLLVRVSVTPNPTHETTNVRTKNVIIKAKRSDGEITKTIQVKICGHVSGFELPQLNTIDKTDYHYDNKALRIVRGENYSLSVNYTTTGTLKTGAKPFTATVDDVSKLTAIPATNYCLLKVPEGGLLTGKSSPLHLRISNGLTDASDVSLPVYTYEKPTSVTYNLHQDNHILKVGGQYILSLTTQPENSLCHISLPSYPSSVSDVEIVNSNNNISSIRFKAAKSTKASETFSPKSGLLSISTSFSIYIDDYTATDIKYGDYVYYKDNGSFDWSDGGLRALGSDFTRYATTSTPPVSDKGTLIGIVYRTYSSRPSEMQDASSIKMAGLGGQFIAVVAAKDAAVGDESGLYWWTSATFNLENEWGLTTSTYPVPKKGEIHTWKVNQGILKYNAKTSDTSKKIKAHYSVEAFGEKDKAGNLYVRVGNTTNAGSSGWLLPTDSDASNILDVLSIIQHSLTAAGATESFSASAKAQKFKGPYWTANYLDDIYALAFGAKNYSETIESEPFQYARNQYTKCVTRPVLFL